VKRLPLTAQELAALGALALIGIGLALWYVPAALVVVGALVLIYILLPDQSPPAPPAQPRGEG